MKQVCLAALLTLNILAMVAGMVVILHALGEARRMHADVAAVKSGLRSAKEAAGVASDFVVGGVTGKLRAARAGFAKARSLWRSNEET